MIELVYILIIFIITIITLYFSKIQLEIENFKVLAGENNIIIESNYKISIKIFILKKVKILDKQIKKINLKSQNSLKKIQNILKKQINDEKKNINVQRIKVLKYLEIRLKELNLKISLGTENAALTAILVGILYSIIPTVCKYFFKLQENIKLEIKPIYQDKNQATFFFEGIFELNLIHIINIYKVLIRKERNKKDDRTSDRKPYAYNNG